jgi:hypothetical protein
MSEEIEVLKHRIAQLEGALESIRYWNCLGNSVPDLDSPGSKGFAAESAQNAADVAALDDRGAKELLELLRQVRAICEDVGLRKGPRGPLWDPPQPPHEM